MLATQRHAAPGSTARQQHGRPSVRRRLAGVAHAQAAEDQPHVAAAMGRRRVLSSAAALAGGLALQPAHVAAAAGDSAPSSLPLVPTAPLAGPGSLNVSRVIKGCWQLSGGHKGDRASDRTGGDAAVADFEAFAAAGISTIDAADHYGPAELLIGRYLQQAGLQARAKLQVATKVCIFSGRDMASLSRESVRAAVDLSRKRLGLDRIDLLQLYWQDYEYPCYVDAALHLTDLVAEGAIGTLGVTNFDVPRLQRMLDAGAQIASNQVGYSLLDRRPQNGMAQFCGANSIGLLCYGTVAGGFLSDRYLGVSARQVNVDTYSKGKYASVLGQAGGWEWLQRLLAALRQVGDKHGGQPIANVASRWVLQQAAVPAVIVGARNASHVPDHQRMFAFELDADDLQQIDAVLADGKQSRGDCYDWERGGAW